MRLALSTIAGAAVLFGLTGSAAAPTASVSQAIGYHNVHLRVADPVAAADWYMKYLGATKAAPPFNLQFGKTLVALVRTTTQQPSEGSAINHIGISFPDLKSKMQEWQAAGVKILTPMTEAAGLFPYGYIEDPWGVKIEVMTYISIRACGSSDPMKSTWYRLRICCCCAAIWSASFFSRSCKALVAANAS